MRCSDCGAIWEVGDLAASACQGCGDPIVPDDLESLREALGFAPQAPPSVEQPVIESSPEAVPESLDCPNIECGMPLMGDDLEKWLSSGCPFCSHPNPSPRPPQIEENVTSDSDYAGDKEKAETEVEESGTLRMIVNLGPMCGSEISVPIGIIGRKEMRALLPDPWYEPHLEKVSSEHFELKDDYGIIDLGSTNGTRISGKRLVSTDPVVLGFSEDLKVGTTIQLSRCPGPEELVGVIFEMSHQESGIRIFLTGSQMPIHLGRLSESEENERWFEMAKTQMESMETGSTTLEYLSRRHFTVSVASETGGFRIETFEGKEEPEVEENSDGSLLIRLAKNNFTIRSRSYGTPLDTPSK